jgi:hypothetical protein
MITEPTGAAEPARDVNDEAYQRMLAARDEIRRIFFSDEAMANEYPLDAPEVIGIHSPDVMRSTPKRRPVG